MTTGSGTPRLTGIIPPPLAFIVLLAGGATAQYFYPVQLLTMPDTIRFLFATLLSISSGCIALAALAVMWKARTDIGFRKPTTGIIMSGPFRFTRNPLYVSLLLLFGAVAFFFNSAWLTAFFALLFLFLNFKVITKEERYLDQCFGTEYLAYKNKVRRWL